jgi:hypothetical protein
MVKEKLQQEINRIQMDIIKEAGNVDEVEQVMELFKKMNSLIENEAPQKKKRRGGGRKKKVQG